MRRRLFSVALALTALASPTVASARPGGGQSFKGADPPRSSGGSSWSGSSDSPSDRSWGGSSRSGSGRSGSSWSFSSRDPSPSPVTPTPPSYSRVDRRELDRQIAVIECRQRCISLIYGSSGDYDKCAARCDAMPAPQPVGTPTPLPSAAPSTDRSMSRAFLIPTGILGAIALLAGVVTVLRRRADRAWASGVIDDADVAGVGVPAQITGTRYGSVAAAIEGVRARDAAFSWVLFEDFLHALYVEVQRARGGGDLAALAPYLSLDAIQAVRASRVDAVETVIVGALSVDDVRVDEADRRIFARVSFTSNYTDVSMGVPRSYYVEEEWQVSRAADLTSRPPARTRIVDCPACGAPLEKVVGDACTHCGAASNAGSHDWRVDAIRIVSRERRGPILVGTTEEVGTDLPTVVAPDVKARYAALVAKDPDVGWQALTARLAKIFHAFHEAWSSQNLELVRPYLSDNLFETQAYWIATYKAQGLRNITEDATIVSVVLSRVTTDAHFDALTVRVYATCRDYTLDAKDVKVGGDRSKPRQYSEYWTLVRGVDRRGAPKVDDGCPNCGGPIREINMAGICKHCDAKVSNGQFDWVLSRIEQDESYRL